jgi:hypothetical protein
VIRASKKTLHAIYTLSFRSRACREGGGAAVSYTLGRPHCGLCLALFSDANPLFHTISVAGIIGLIGMGFW